MSVPSPPYRMVYFPCWDLTQNPINPSIWWILYVSCPPPSSHVNQCIDGVSDFGTSKHPLFRISLDESSLTEIYCGECLNFSLSPPLWHLELSISPHRPCESRYFSCLKNGKISWSCYVYYNVRFIISSAANLAIVSFVVPSQCQRAAECFNSGSKQPYPWDFCLVPPISFGKPHFYAGFWLTNALFCLSANCQTASVLVCGVEVQCSYDYNPSSSAPCNANEIKIDCVQQPFSIAGRICVVRTRTNHNKFPIWFLLYLHDLWHFLVNLTLDCIRLQHPHIDTIMQWQSRTTTRSVLFHRARQRAASSYCSTSGLTCTVKDCINAMCDNGNCVVRHLCRFSRQP